MKTLLAILLSLSITCLADEPVIFELSEGNDSYTVPENCVLAIDAVSTLQTWKLIHASIIIDDKVVPWVWTFPRDGVSSDPTHSHYTFDRPVRIPGGAVLTVLAFHENDGYTFFGSLEKKPRFSWWR